MEVDHNRLVKELYDMTAGEVMDARTWDLPIIAEDTPIEHVMQILTSKDHVWVVNSLVDRHLLGVITEKDVLEILSPAVMDPVHIGRVNIRSLHLGTIETAGDCMRSRLVTAFRDTPIEKILSLMTKYRVRRMPILEGRVIVGEITLKTIINRYMRCVTMGNCQVPPSKTGKRGVGGAAPGKPRRMRRVKAR